LSENSTKRVQIRFRFRLIYDLVTRQIKNCQDNPKASGKRANRRTGTLATGKRVDGQTGRPFDSAHDKRANGPTGRRAHGPTGKPFIARF